MIPVSYANHRGDRLPHISERFDPCLMTYYAEIASEPMPCQTGHDAFIRQLAVLERGIRDYSPEPKQLRPSELKRIAASKQRRERFLATCEEKKASLCASVMAVLKDNGPLQSGRLSALMGKHRTALLETLMSLERSGKVIRLGQQSKTQWVAL